MKEENKEIIMFEEKGTYKSLYAAEGWATENGYSYGSLDAARGNPVALRKGVYDLPQKWHNFTREHKESVDGIMQSTDWREGKVQIIIYNSKRINS